MGEIDRANDDVSVEQIEAILESLDAEMSPQQRDADRAIQRLENGCSPEVHSHVVRFCSDDAYAREAVEADRQRAMAVLAICQG
ncbi:MAG: hypothetical protein HQL42_06095 [Alphaproteobacteria bacterium]|nr:hypothetical protein [Alphaproteobacteria bacterium]